MAAEPGVSVSAKNLYDEAVPTCPSQQIFSHTVFGVQLSLFTLFKISARCENLRMTVQVQGWKQLAAVICT